METYYLVLVIFLFLLACFDLFVGVSNDAVNFLNSAIGARAASFRTILVVAAAGVFLGASMSNGMMDVARHGIFRPEMFTFENVMCIFLAVMVTDILLLDVFNSLGMPTSTTVSMVFELLGASFVLALIKSLAPEGAGTALVDYLNSEKALQVVLAIFMSVAIAFVVGTLVQWVVRLVFTFDYRRAPRPVLALFGGLALTAIAYFMLFKGMSGLTFMTPATRGWLAAHEGSLLVLCWAGFSVMMWLLALLRVDTLRVVVLAGTFALALAFAGNDLVNFIGVPLAGYDAFIDFSAHGTSPSSFMMNSLNESARTPLVFLIASGGIMVFSLAKSKKAYNVVKTSVNLARQDAGDEMFGSSRVARSLVRGATSLAGGVMALVPTRVQRFVDSRFKQPEQPLPDGAAFDMVRASVNLVVAALLIALGTSLKLPLSTTYVTFIVAMGTSLADRAWGRESAVFRITGVLAVIGGWFITAGVAFVSCAAVAACLYFGGRAAAVVVVVLAVVLLVHNNVRYSRRQKAERKDVLFARMLAAPRAADVWPLLRQHLLSATAAYLTRTVRHLQFVDQGLVQENLRSLRRVQNSLRSEKAELKSLRRKETVCLRRCTAEDALRQSAWFHFVHNCLEQLHYCTLRMEEACREHVDNNFKPLPPEEADELDMLLGRLMNLMASAAEDLEGNGGQGALALRTKAKELRTAIVERRHALQATIRTTQANLTTAYLYLSLLQEAEIMAAILRQLLRAVDRLGRPALATDEQEASA